MLSPSEDGRGEKFLTRLKAAFSKGDDMKDAMMKLKEHASKPASKAHKGLKAGGMATKMGAVKTGSKPDGIAMKGKTKGTMVKMARGGKAC